MVYLSAFFSILTLYWNIELDEVQIASLLDIALMKLIAVWDGALAEKARLEVSGIRKGHLSTLKRRVKEKLAQTRRSAGKLPVYVVVIQFGRPLGGEKMSRVVPFLGTRGEGR